MIAPPWRYDAGDALASLDGDVATVELTADDNATQAIRAAEDAAEMLDGTSATAELGRMITPPRLYEQRRMLLRIFPEVPDPRSWEQTTTQARLLIACGIKQQPGTAASGRQQ